MVLKKSWCKLRLNDEYDGYNGCLKVSKMVFDNFILAFNLLNIKGIMDGQMHTRNLSFIFVTLCAHCVTKTYPPI
jgi:hypothetical protein